jgi:hypothetical protein
MTIRVYEQLSALQPVPVSATRPGGYFDKLMESETNWRSALAQAREKLL